MRLIEGETLVGDELAMESFSMKVCELVFVADADGLVALIALADEQVNQAWDLYHLN